MLHLIRHSGPMEHSSNPCFSIVGKRPHSPELQLLALLKQEKGDYRGKCLRNDLNLTKLIHLRIRFG